MRKMGHILIQWEVHALTPKLCLASAEISVLQPWNTSPPQLPDNKEAVTLETHRWEMGLMLTLDKGCLAVFLSKLAWR